jgi:NADH-quinone oxidoreductase subunit N
MILGGVGMALVPMAGWLRGRWQVIPMIVAIIGMAAAMGVTAYMIPWEPQMVFCETYAVDGFGSVMKLLMELGALITLAMLWSYFRGHSHMAQAPVAVVFTTLGCIGLASAIDLVLIVLFLQMLSLAGYLLVSLIRSDNRANEAALKLFIYAAAAMAIMAYGLSFFYGLTGSLNLQSIGRSLSGGADPMWIALSAGLVLTGYAFEATLAPFHFWAPDVYTGSTAPIAGFLSVVPKIAGFAGLIRFAVLALPDGMVHWPLAMAIIAVLTMVVGNLLALRQTRLKRLLAYSSIAQAGYVLVAVVVADQIPGAFSAVGYYLAVYLFMNLGAFTVVAQVERAVGSDELAAFHGFGRRAPWSAAVLLLSLLSLAGIPPLAGFAGKIFVLTAAMDGGMTWLAVVAIVNMTVALYYYIAVAAQMVFKAPRQEWAPPVDAGYGVALGISVAGSLILGILPALGLAVTDMMSRWV